MINNVCINIIKEYIGKNDIEGVYITNSTNLKYILGKDIAQMIYVEEDKVYVMVGSIYLEEAKKICTDGIEYINISDKSSKEKLIEILSGKIVGIEVNNITVAHERKLINEYSVKKTIDIENILENIRKIKYNNELVNIKKACEITKRAFEYILTYIKVGQTERQIRNELNRYMFELGAEDIAFDTIVASGPNSSNPHAIVTDRVIDENDIILFDFGAKYNGYCSDMSRTIFVGRPNDKIVKIYKSVLKAQKLGINSITPKLVIGNLHETIVEEFKKENIDKYFIHTTGHGVGMEIHESPIIYTSNKSEVFEENMVVTVEPGIYFENEFGIRIEDTILVTNEGSKILTDCNKEIIII